MTTGGNFFERLAPLTTNTQSFDSRFYAPAPGDWLLAVTDVESSTKAVEAGRYQLVNMAGAAGIAAVRNACAGETIPFLFGGDGAAVLVPPAHAAATREALAVTCGYAEQAYDLKLRAGAMTVAEIRRHGRDVMVARYEPTPGNNFGLFAGGGVQLLERAVKGREPRIPPDSIAIETIRRDEPPDLSGLSCRWAPLRSRRGKMVALIITGAIDARAIYDRILATADPGQRGVSPIDPATLKPRWPPKTLMLEARQMRGPLLVNLVRLLGLTFVSWLVFRRGKPFAGFDPQRYVGEMARNTDFSKVDDSLALVIDCPVERIAAIRALLDELHDRGDLSYGIHVSDTALMTCLVESATSYRHVHFVDGGEGGYTMAARDLKQRVGAGDSAATREAAEALA